MRTSARRVSSRRGFTLVELLVVLAIIGIITSITIPAVMQGLAAARRTSCANNLRQLGAAAMAFDTEHERFPGLFENGLISQYNPAGNPLGIPVRGQLNPWVVPMLPHLEEQQRYDYITTGGLDTAANLGLLRIMQCASDPYRSRNSGEMSYVANAGVPDDLSGSNPGDFLGTGIFYDRSMRGVDIATARIDMTATRIRDGAATTLLFVENVNAGPWILPAPNPEYNAGNPSDATQIMEWRVGTIWVDGATPANTFFTDRRDVDPASLANPWELARPSSFHSQTFNVVFADGTVNNLSNGIEYITYCRLMTSDSSRLPAGSYGVGVVDQTSFAK